MRDYRAARVYVALAMMAAAAYPGARAGAQELEIKIFGSAQAVVDEYKEAGYWGKIEHGERIDVPPYLTVVTSPTWDKEAASLPVDVKKELFYRTLLPLILYSNEVILEDRRRLGSLGAEASGPDREWLAGLAVSYRLLEPGASVPEGPELKALVEALKRRVDAVPPSLALGQAAYESGYGTSRFAREGNALFGQWTYGGKGMKPNQKRAEKGDYGVAAYEWPLDSVRGYMRNLNTHRAYQALRDKRAEVRSAGRSPSGEELAATLLSYSEKGAEYVKILTRIMRANELAVADAALLRQAPAIVIIDVPGAERVAEMQAEIEGLRKTGELAEILRAMGVDLE